MTCFSTPRSIVAGDSVNFPVTGSGYDSPEYTGKFVISTPGAPVTFNLTPDAPNHRVVMAPDATSVLDYGIHGYSYIWAKTGFRKTDGVGSILILPDPTVALKPSFSMQCLTKVEGAILKLSSNTNASVDVDGQIYTKRNFKELCDYRDRLIATVEAELARIGRPVSRGGAKTIRTVFRS